MFFQNGAPFIVASGSTLLLYSQSGEMISSQIFARVTDSVDEPSEALVKMLVNIVGSEEEMLRKIEDFKKENEEYQRKRKEETAWI